MGWPSACTDCTGRTQSKPVWMGHCGGGRGKPWGLEDFVVALKREASNVDRDSTHSFLVKGNILSGEDYIQECSVYSYKSTFFFPF